MPYDVNDYWTEPACGFPKIAAVIGAQTDVGQNLLRDLLHSPEIDYVHAITPTEIPLIENMPRNSPELLKARIHITPFDKLERAFKRISECDLAFCCSTTDRHPTQIKSSDFRLINYTAPVKFIRQMFELSVLHISILSHADSDEDARSEYCKLKGDMEAFARMLRKEAGEYSPFITVFKPPTLRSGSSSRNSNAYDPRDTGIDSKDVAKAMQIEAFGKCARHSTDSREKRSRFGEMYEENILHLVHEMRLRR